MAIHIGEKIKNRATELRMGPTELGKLVNTSKQNIYGIYKRKSIDSELLRKFCKVLDYDFFQYYSIEKPSIVSEPTAAYKRKKDKQPVSMEEFYRLKQELSELREKYELLKKINTLLEKKK